MTDQTTFVHISDTHIAPTDQIAYDTDTAQNLRDVARRVREMALDPACFIFSGDLSNHGEPESYARLAEIVDEAFRPFGVPVLLGLGNHDSRLPFRQTILGQTDAADEQVQHYYSATTRGLKGVMLASLVPGEVHGFLGDEQLGWLDQELAEGAPGGQVIARHDVLAVLCGHSHVPTFGLFATTLHVAAPATAYQLDPSMREGGRGLEGASFNICTVRDGRLMVNLHMLPSSQRELYRHTRTFTSMSAAETEEVAIVGGATS